MNTRKILGSRLLIISLLCLGVRATLHRVLSAQHLALRGAVWASESPLPDPLLWAWAEPAWAPSAYNSDHLAANAGWWCVRLDAWWPSTEHV
jgi:hypothetical protein